MTSYTARHQRLHWHRGKASAHSCYRCSNRAEEWAQIHTEDGEDPWSDYVPLCKACHANYDKVARKRGERHHNAVLSDESVEIMKELRRLGVSRREIAEAAGVSKGHSDKILRGVKRQ